MLARSGHERGRARRVRRRGAQSEPLAVIPNSRCQTAQCCSFPRRVAAPGFFPSCRTPLRRDFAVTRLRQTSARKQTGRFQPPRRRTPAPPMRGGWSADRRTHSIRSRLRRATTLSRGDRDLSRRSTVAISDADPRSPAPGSGTGAASDCPRPALMPGGRGPDLPVPRFAPQRGTPLPAPPSGSSPEDAPP